MKPEQIEQLKQMSVMDRVRKYLPLLQNGKITQKQYDYILEIKNEVIPKNSGGVSSKNSQGNKNTGYVGEIGEITETIIREFGGKEVESGKTSQKERLLALLGDGEWHTTPEIQEQVYGANHLGVARIASRVSDLRKEGYDIESKKYDKSIWMYRYIKK